MTEGNKKERSRAYPVMALEDALNRIASINENLGLNGQFNRESIAVGMGYSSLNGASARAVAALVHFGLLDREKDQYALSQVAKKYLLPVNDTDKEDAMHDAALSPSLFSEIYGAFKGQVIPRQFANRLIQEFGIQQKAAADVERIFRNTMQTAGFLKSNGILTAETAEKPATVSPASVNEAETLDAVYPSSATGSSVPYTSKGYLSVELPSGLVVSYPQSLASAFAFGQFGQKLKELDSTVDEYAQSLKQKDNDHE